MDNPEERDEEEQQDMFGPGVSDLVTHALDQKPLDFQATFDYMLKDKIADAVAARKYDLASEIANQSEDELEDEEPEESEDEDEDEDAS